MEEICAADKDDLVILVGHLPDRDEAVLFSYDCILSQELGVRSAKAAGNVKFLSVLWDEHQDRIKNPRPALESKKTDSKLKTGLIAGASAAILAVAIGLLLASSLRKEVVVIKVEP